VVIATLRFAEIRIVFSVTPCLLGGFVLDANVSKLGTGGESVLKVGLTGGIASGKSTVGEMFVALGAHLVQADQIAHQLMQPGEAVYTEVVNHFGAGILNPDGTVNRPRLAEAAFGASGSTGNAPSRVEELNRIVHPAVIKRQEEWMDEVGRRDPQAIAIVEAALILEAGAGPRFDRLVVVTCGPGQRVQRWAGRIQVDDETARHEVARRMAAQLPDDEKIKASDYVIDNSGSLDQTTKQVQAVYEKLRGLAV
jgi:dephospho-CoA kinase